MEASMTKGDAQEQLVSERSQGVMEASLTIRDMQKQLKDSEGSQGEMEASMTEKDTQKQLYPESSQGEMEASMPEKDTQKQLKDSDRSQGDFEELEKMVKCLKEENTKLKEKLIQQEKVMDVVVSDHEKKLHEQKICMELKEESWKVELSNLEEKSEKQLSELKMSMELKEGSWMVERSNLKEEFEMQLNELETSMEQKKEGWKMELKTLQDEIEKQLNEQKLKEESWEKKQSKLQEQFDKLFQENSTNVEQLSAYQQLYNKDKLITGSPLERFPGLLPLWMSTAVAPKGYISGDELGVLTANLINITAMVVSFANKDTKVMFPFACLTLCGTVVGSMFNNMVTHLSMDPEAKLFPTLKKSISQVPWVLAGSVVSLLVGGFIHDWKIRCAVTSAASLAVQLTSVGIWKASYNISVKTTGSIVGFGIVGTALAAGLPHLIAMIFKK